MKAHLARLPVVFFLFVFSFFAISYSATSYVFAENEADKLEEINRQIAEYESKINELQTRAGTLSNQIAQFDAQIHLTELKISQTQEQILLLGGRIDQLSASLVDLENAFESRAVETYKITRASKNGLMVISAPGINEAVSRFHYLRKIQEADRNLLTKLQTTQEAYQTQKGELESLQQVLGTQKENLDTQKNAKSNLLVTTKNDEKKYQQLLAEAKVQKSSFLRFISGQGGASILSNQTKCDSWGCYYNQRDSEWGRNSLGLSGSSVAEYGCLVSSVSMVASHYGKNIKPVDIASVSDAFFSDTALLLNDFTVNGVNVHKVHASKSILDSELAAGRPVIAGLYSGPDHFIVILRKEGSNYIMHDPFMENGANRPLTDKYNVSDITSLRLITFN